VLLGKGAPLQRGLLALPANFRLGWPLQTKKCHLDGEVPGRLVRLEMLKLGGHDLVQQRVEFAEVGQFVDRLFMATFDK